MSLIVPTKYIKYLTEENDKVARFLQSVASQSPKTAEGYGMGISHFANFIKKLDDVKNRNYPKSSYTLNEIVESILKNEINVYDILEDFLYYLMSEPLRLPNGNVVPNKKLSNRSLQFYVSTIRSYFDYNDVDIIPSKFKRRVKVPKLLKYPEKPIDASDIRLILNSCNNRRLKAYLLCLGSGGMRALEGVGIRLSDINFNTNPTTVHIRPINAKTRLGRDVFISDEATKYLKEWIDFKYRDRQRNDSPEIIKDDDDLVFQQVNTKDVTLRNIYRPLVRDFNNILKTLKMDDRKEGMLRRKVTLHSIRRFVYSTISTYDNAYAEFFIGHKKSSYWTKKPEELREIYANKCMKYLTFLDYSELEATGKSIEAKLEEKDREIQLIKSEHEKYKQETDQKLDKIIRSMSKNPKLLRIKPKVLKRKIK
jgi:integrase